MALAVQPSLFDERTDTTTGNTTGTSTEDSPGFADLVALRRTPLTRGAWVDHLPGWLVGADRLFADLVEGVPWRAERRQMYERVVDVPRLLCFYGEQDPLPHPALVEARDRLSASCSRA